MFKSRRFSKELEVESHIENADFHRKFLVSVEIASDENGSNPKQPLLEPSSRPSVSPNLSDWQALMHIIKASVGTGVLAFPAAFRDAGLFLGCLTFVLITFIVTHTLHLLLAANRRLALRFSENFTYAETVEYTMKTGPRFLQNFLWLKQVVNVSMIIGQLGMLVVFHIFLAENIKSMVDYYELIYSPKLIFYQLGVCLPLVFMVFVRSLKTMSFLSCLSNILAFSGLILIIVFCCQDLMPVESLPQFKPISSYALTFGVVIFAFESVNVILPIERRMINRKSLTRPNGILNLAVTIVFALFFATGFYGYLRFGESVPGAITYAIPMSPWYFMLSKQFYTVSILANYSLQSHVLFGLVWERLDVCVHSIRARQWGDSGLRVGCVVSTFLLGVAVPRIDIVISLLGALTGSLITIIFPCFVNSVIVWTDFRHYKYCGLIIFKDVCITAVGVVGAIAGTYACVISIIYPL